MASFLGDSSKTVTEIRSDLVCQMCKRPGKKRWYRCLKLHYVCEECKNKNKKCSCNQPISKKYDKTTEKMLSALSMKYNCGNTNNGCQEVLTETALEDHEYECIYRLVPCIKNTLDPSEECNEKVTFRDVIQHFEDHDHDGGVDQELVKVTLEEHDLKIKHRLSIDDEIGLVGKDCYNDPIKFTLSNQTFLLAHKIEDKVVYTWIYILGSPRDAKHFSFTLKFYGKNAELSFKGKVTAIDESFDTLSKAGKYFAIPHKTFVDLFLDEEHMYEYSLEIQNLKEEAKDDNYESGISDNDEDSKE